MRKLSAVAVVGLFATVAFAGKPERDKANELKTAVAAAEAQIKASCGCASKINVKWESYTKANDMRRIPNTLDDITTATKAQCQSPEDKKAYCGNVTGYEISYKLDGGTASLNGKTIVLTTSDAAYPGNAQITAIISKF